MSYIGFETEASTNASKTVADLAPPAQATHCELQASVQPITYRCDGIAAASGVGMTLNVADLPKLFLIEQLQDISFIRFATDNGVLGIHYIGTDIP